MKAPYSEYVAMTVEEGAQPLQPLRNHRIDRPLPRCQQFEVMRQNHESGVACRLGLPEQTLELALGTGGQLRMS